MFAVGSVWGPLEITLSAVTLPEDAHIQNPTRPNTGMQFLWAHNSKQWLYIHTPHTSSKHGLQARRAPGCNCMQHQVSVFKRSLDFHELYHKSHAPLKCLSLGTQKSSRGKFKHLGNQFAINSWLQQVILPQANTLCYRRNCFSSLQPSLSYTRTHTHAPQVDCAVMLTGEENCFLTFPVINLHPEAWDWFHFSVYM